MSAEKVPAPPSNNGPRLKIAADGGSSDPMIAVREIAEKMAAEYPDSVEEAVEKAERKISRLSEFDEVVKTLVRRAVKSYVHDYRHASNVRNWTLAGKYGRESREAMEKSNEGWKTVSIYLNHCVEGRALKSIRGNELAAMAQRENSRSDGHTLNSRLLKRLIDYVPADKTVGEAVSEKRLKEIFEAASK